MQGTCSMNTNYTMSRGAPIITHRVNHARMATAGVARLLSGDPAARRAFVSNNRSSANPTYTSSTVRRRAR
jgi:hypothetical protein